jgi:hypothetical protein
MGEPMVEHLVLDATHAAPHQWLLVREMRLVDSYRGQYGQFNVAWCPDCGERREYEAASHEGRRD